MRQDKFSRLCVPFYSKKKQHNRRAHLIEIEKNNGQKCYLPPKVHETDTLMTTNSIELLLLK